MSYQWQYNNLYAGQNHPATITHRENELARRMQAILNNEQESIHKSGRLRHLLEDYELFFSNITSMSANTARVLKYRKEQLSNSLVQQSTKADTEAHVKALNAVDGMLGALAGLEEKIRVDRASELEILNIELRKIEATGVGQATLREYAGAQVYDQPTPPASGGTGEAYGQGYGGQHMTWHEHMNMATAENDTMGENTNTGT